MRLLFYNIYFALGVMFYSVCGGKVGKYKDKGRPKDKSVEIKIEKRNDTYAVNYVVPRARIQLLYPRGFCISVPGRQRGQTLLRKIECHVNINRPFKANILGVVRGRFYFRERSHPRRYMYRFHSTAYEFKEGDHFFVLIMFAKKNPFMAPSFFYEEGIVTMHRRGYLELAPLELPQTAMPSVADELRLLADAHPYNISWGINKKSKPRPRKVKRKKPLPVKAAKKLKDKALGKVG